MNANQIHPGEEYAVCPYSKPKGNDFIPNALRVKAMRVFGEQEMYNKRLTMFIEGFRLDATTGDILSTTYGRYRVRDVIEDWDEYEDNAEREQIKRDKEQEERNRLRAEQEAEYRRRQAEQMALATKRREDEALRQEKVAQGIQELRSKMEKYSLAKITIDPYSGKVNMELVDLLAWLNSLEKIDCDTCDKQFTVLPQGV